MTALSFFNSVQVGDIIYAKPDDSYSADLHTWPLKVTEKRNDPDSFPFFLVESPNLSFIALGKVDISRPPTHIKNNNKSRKNRKGTRKARKNRRRSSRRN